MPAPFDPGYGAEQPIPMDDLPAGTPAWMASDDGWAGRPGTGSAKPASILVTVPSEALPAG